MFNLLPFQIDAVDELTSVHTQLWKRNGDQLPLVFKSPTGSGKTIMLAHFIKGLNKLPNWDINKAFVWITFSDELAMQSKHKFQAYFQNNLENGLRTSNDIEHGKFLKNDILFLNWQKVVSKSAENRLLRRPEDTRFAKEYGNYFEDFIDGAHATNRSLILIIDESHTNVTIDLAQQIIDYIQPKTVLHVSATPKPEIVAKAADLKSYVVVDRERVVLEGLIKEKIVTQTEEDLNSFRKRDLDEALLDLGLTKRTEIKKEFDSLGKKINPLLLIQLPNDDRERVQIGEKTKEVIVTEYLTKNGIKENKIARWFDDNPKPEGLEENEDEHDVLLFKLAAGTGWDCPRAHVLVMFRNVRVEQRYIQTVGRILRMAEPDKRDDYKNSPNLRTGFLYTNYNRQDIIENWIDKTQNKPFVFISYRKKGITNIALQSAYVSRIKYNDLSSSNKFQASFIESMNKYFDITSDDILGGGKLKIEGKGLDLNPILTNKIIVDAELDDFDRIDYEFKNKGHDVSMEMSQNDAEKTFNYYCWKVLDEQTHVDSKITNVSRSWSPLKSALRIWLKNTTGEASNFFYRVFINDINKNTASIFRPAITQALIEYKPILEKILEKRNKEDEERAAPTFSIQESYSFTDDYEEQKVKLFALEKFYLRKQHYVGKDNENSFIDYLEGKDREIEWWFKQENGQDYFAIKYFNTSEQKAALFYPDWIVKFKDGRTGIFDTKSGRTATNTEGRAQGLASELNILGKKYVGGIIVKESGVWYFNNSINYEYAHGNLTKDWKLLETVFKRD